MLLPSSYIVWQILWIYDQSIFCKKKKGRHAVSYNDWKEANMQCCIPFKIFNKSLKKPPLHRRRFNHISNAFPMIAIGFLKKSRIFCARTDMTTIHRLLKFLSPCSSWHSMNPLPFMLEETKKRIRSRKLASVGSSSSLFW